MKEITYTNHVRIGEQRWCLDDLPKEQKEDIVNAINYRALLTIPNDSARLMAVVVDKPARGDEL